MQLTYLIMLCKEIVGDGYSRGAVDDVNKPIGGPSKIAMIDPYVGGIKYVDGVAVGAAAVAHVGGAIPHNPRLPGLAIMDANPVYDHMAHVLYSDAGPKSNLNPNPSPINGLVTIYHQLILKPDHHAPSEHNPKWARLDDAVTERPPLGDRRVVRGVRDDVDAAVFAPDGVAPEPHRAVRQGAAVGGPIGLGAPT